MRKLSSLIIVGLLTLAGAARAQEEAPAPTPAGEPAAGGEPGTPAPAAVAAADSKLEVGVAFLPMLLGKVTGSSGSGSDTKDAAMAYGVGITAGYAVIPGLTVGIAPQAIFNVKLKDGNYSAAKEFDLMLRVAYAYKVIPALAVYGEVLPGYSIISLPSEYQGMSSPKGFVVAFGAGAAYDINDQLFVNLGVGYQMGFQKATYEVFGTSTDVDFKLKYLRIALGAGMKF